MSMRFHVMNFLARDPSLERVHFRYDDGSRTHLVHTGDYRTIAERIRAETLEVRWEPGRPGRAPASYLGLENLMVIRSPQANLEDLVFKSNVVHEATHAIFDMRCSDPELTDEESVAFLAQFIWLREFRSRAGNGVARGSGRTPPRELVRINDAAAAVVDRHNLTRRRPTLGRRDLDDLRAAVAAHPSYRGNAGNSYYRNGIPRQRVQAEYFKSMPF